MHRLGPYFELKKATVFQVPQRSTASRIGAMTNHKGLSVALCVSHANLGDGIR